MRPIDADALKELFSEVIGRIAIKPEMNGNLEHMIRASAMVIQMIDDAPTVQPEMNCSEFPNNWIPCSERLPEIDKEVLVTDGELCWVCSLFESQDIEDGLYQWEDNYGHWHEFETWVAWMPLPEPYQEGGEADE